ncbi:RNA 2',3'-cyclic phosphodiesterase [Wenxinia marina]|uniref:RNA 2',3'-cyclic phosphodiesterase n=1 Tax=Wenxinia marina DSM 24838 TaxID=1123501 RepID=A0A0D0PBM0_9RHOB|nr:RNA 2',3'-cyclic phosphodiesterase [Wenxinia marina]KIQ68841.1 2'-5' RNA ligase [Wenxinia marina DSM 24838]GGL64790.1 RNA 2',3'-cyclic phosphodiesterase [Wenxinia marina]
MRCFVALPLPAGPVRALEAVQDGLKLGRPTDPEQMHLTLAFLGERPDADIEAAHEALSDIRRPAFEVRIRGLDTFRTPDGGLTIWAALADPAPVAALAAKVRSALHGVGLPLERRRFRPHVTLTRLSPAEATDEPAIARALARWSAFPCPPFTADEMVLYRSTLLKSGAVHDDLARYPLEGGSVAFEV